jgi:hypothetical protein
MSQQRFDLASQTLVASACRSQEASTFRRRQVGRLLKQFFNMLPAVVTHSDSYHPEHRRSLAFPK